MRTLVGWVIAALLLGSAAPGRAQDLVVLHQVIGSWQGDDGAQLVELRMLAAGQGSLAGIAQLRLDDPSGAPETRRFFSFLSGVARQEANAHILLATQRLLDLIPGFTADFVIPDGYLSASAGRICYQLVDGRGNATIIDCLAYGDYQGNTGRFGPPLLTAPENRSLLRVGTGGVNRDDWETRLEPLFENNTGIAGILRTLCGNDRIDQGEDCDGDQLGGATCTGEGFARGKLRCGECHFDTAKCSFCGNDVINEKEECDGSDLGGNTCESLGFEGGTLGCTDACRLSIDECPATFYVTGGRAKKRDCYAAFRVASTTTRPSTKGKAPKRIVCHDGDPVCDTDAVSGTCTVPLAICFGRSDARLPKCTPEPIGTWTLKRPRAGEAGAALLTAAVAAAGSGRVDGAGVVFDAGLAGEVCTEDVALELPASKRSRLSVVSQTSPSAGRGKDVDKLKLSCVP